MNISKAPAVEYFNFTIEANRVHEFPSPGKVKQVGMRLERSEMERIRNFLNVVELEEAKEPDYEGSIAVRDLVHKEGERVLAGHSIG